MTRTRLLAAALLAALVAAALVARAAHRPPVTLARPYAPLPAPATPAALTPATAPPATATSATRTSATPAPAAAPADAATARAALRALDRARAAAYADPLTGDPDDWAARTCPCHAADAARLRALARAGRALRGHATRLDAVRVVRATPRALDLVVRDRLGPYTAVDARSRVVARWPATPVRTWRIRLVRAGGRWLLGRIARAP